MKRLIIKNLSDIDRVAKEFAGLTIGYPIIAFYGSMGAGKTTFIKALCKALKVDDIVNSPTFTIVNEYKSQIGFSIYHFDFYRISKIQEAIDLGFEEYIYSDGICLMEWPEKIEEILPEETLKVNINVLEDGSREIILNGYEEEHHDCHHTQYKMA
jgi:tRNA threonylcarbamoyladenosine biosynthesis protein TsaE